MINVIISGCNGKMGQVISGLIEKEPDMKVAAGFDTSGIQKNAYPVYVRPRDCREKADVIIDFSTPDSLEPLLEYALFRKIPLVIATTGHTQTQKSRMVRVSKSIPIFQSANMSIGTNLVADLISKAARILHEGFDIEIIDKHHNQKIDAPSGTALMFADSINSTLPDKYEYVYNRHSKREKRSANEIGIHSIRGGTIVGEHSVIFAGDDEIVEIKHTAMSRNIFGRGALKAARFIIGKPAGMYRMSNIINQTQEQT